jgi:hypothetical protein
MISVGPSENGHNVYVITQAGRVRLGQIRVLMQIAPRLSAPDDDEKPGDDELEDTG